MAAWIVALACVPMAHAGAIYKCTVKGAVVFQDQPCPGHPSGQARHASPDDVGDFVVVDIGRLPPAALMQRIKALATQDRALETQRDQAQARLKSRLAGEHDDRVVSLEVERFKHDWQQRLAVLRDAQKAALDRLRQLCPGGASGGGDQVTCAPGNPRLGAGGT